MTDSIWNFLQWGVLSQVTSPGSTSLWRKAPILGDSDVSFIVVTVWVVFGAQNSITFPLAQTLSGSLVPTRCAVTLLVWIGRWVQMPLRQPMIFSFSTLLNSLFLFKLMSYCTCFTSTNPSVLNLSNFRYFVCNPNVELFTIVCHLTPPGNMNVYAVPLPVLTSCVRFQLYALSLSTLSNLMQIYALLVSRNPLRTLQSFRPHTKP